MIENIVPGRKVRKISTGGICEILMTCRMKVDREWRSSVAYKPIWSDTVYVRPLNDFLEHFTLIEET